MKRMAEDHAAKPKYLETLRRIRPEAEALVDTDLAGQELEEKILELRQVLD